MQFSKTFRAALIIVCCSVPVSATELAVPRLKTAPQSTDKKPAGPARPEATVHNYGAGDKACVSWTDGCVNCSRGDGDLGECSNTGPACQPGKIRCVSRK